MKQLFLLAAAALLHIITAQAQNVGVGTKTPATRLHVVDSVNDVQLRVESPAAGSEVFLRLLAGANPFSTLQISKYAPGALGTFADIPKDNLSVISTGGNAASLLLATGDGVSPLIFAAGLGEQMRITAEGRVGIGTPAPATAYKLHVHNGTLLANDVSIGLTTEATTSNNLRGIRLRLLDQHFILMNYETGGDIRFATEGAETKMIIKANGNVGISELNPVHKLHISTTSATNGIYVDHLGSGTTGIRSSMGGGTTNVAAVGGAAFNNSSGANYMIGVYAQSGSGGVMLTPNSNYGVIGESLNTTRGTGVFGGSSSPSATLTEAAVFGLNWSTAANSYGIIGKSGGITGAGVAGVALNANNVGILGLADLNNATAMKAQVTAGINATALEVANGPIKVSGTNRTAFQHQATAGNIVSNETVIPATTQANSSTDLLFVTPVWEGVYVNAPIGVYFSSGSWRIFRQDLGAMPVNAKFNVLVIKQ
jgi:hypothetical protein